MKLTKLQRHTIYIVALAEAESLQKFNTSLCFVIRDIFFPSASACDVIHNYLPELYKLRPVDKNSVYDTWFPESKNGWGKRIEILQQCIKETA